MNLVVRTLDERAGWIEAEAAQIGRAYGGERRDDREEFAAEAMARACRVWAQFPKADERYVARAMRNAVLDLLRKRKARAGISVPEHELGLREGEGALPHEGASPMDLAFDRDEADRARAVLDALPSDLRTAFVVSATEGLAGYVRASGLTRACAQERARAARARVQSLAAAL